MYTTTTRIPIRTDFLLVQIPFVVRNDGFLADRSDSDGDRILVIELADNGRHGAYGKVLPVASSRIAVHATTPHSLLLDRTPHSENSSQSRSESLPDRKQGTSCME